MSAQLVKNSNETIWEKSSGPQTEQANEPQPFRLALTSCNLIEQINKATVLVVDDNSRGGMKGKLG
jgi:hypothetical protein